MFTDLIDREVRPGVQHLRSPVHGGAVLGQLVLQDRPLVHVPVLGGLILLGAGGAEVAESHLVVLSQ